jgi:DNA modification methylase
MNERDIERSDVVPIVKRSAYSLHGNRIYIGDALEKLREWPGESVQCVVTSPPYWGLRDYGHDGQIGLEKTPEEYIAKLVSVFEEVRRVLKKDGTLWLNLGDTYAGSGRGRDGDGTWNPGKGGSKQETNKGAITGRTVNAKSLSKKLIEAGAIGNAWTKPPQGYKAKDLIGIPWSVALGLRESGWWLRCDIIWNKPNPMPESVTDRPTRSHEYIFLLSKSDEYYYDNDAVREPYTKPLDRWGGEVLDRVNPKDGTQGNPASLARQRDMRPNKDGRNRRSVWEINTEPFAGAHFATFPTELVRLCVAAGSREGDIVADPFCGSGTTGEVAMRMKRIFWGIEINEKYVREIAEPRLNNVEPLFKDAVAVL